MTTKYKVFKMVFDMALFAEALRAVKPEDVKVFCDVIEIDVSTFMNWRAVTGNYVHGHPSMKCFLSACNALDLDPRAYFVLAHQDEA
jgi:hypothetical protein